MKLIKQITSTVLAVTFLAAPFVGFAADSADKKAEKAKPYTLKTCPVSDEKLGEMGDPYVFTYKGQEVKLCCKDCKKDFDKDPDKFVKKIAKAEKKAEKK